jgi:hypothetical protein
MAAEIHGGRGWARSVVSASFQGRLLPVVHAQQIPVRSDVRLPSHLRSTGDLNYIITDIGKRARNFSLSPAAEMALMRHGNWRRSVLAFGFQRFAQAFRLEQPFVNPMQALFLCRFEEWIVFDVE